ncbi:MAG: branched chain amino acid aminotransferase, partial [Bifidobacteriaceae bacterium]|nr:branched chain amino acid aminotransferase [Bifidobacteriaceae bacterium]
MSQLTTSAGPAFALDPHPSPTSPAARAEQLVAPGFGVVFTDHMASIQWRAGEGWSGHAVVPHAPLSLWPATSVLHYAQAIFEGLKAYRWADGSIHTFRPQANAERFQKSAQRLALPELPAADFIASLEALVSVDRDWVPGEDGTSLYLRPFMYASESFLGVRPSHTVHYLA